jgi:adenine phosphoribosyltransferase
LVDDLIATGGTAEAGIKLIQKLGSELIECAFLIDLPELGGAKRIENLGISVYSLTQFEGH